MTGLQFFRPRQRKARRRARAQLDPHLRHTLAGVAFGDDRQVLARHIASEIANCDFRYAPFLAEWALRLFARLAHRLHKWTAIREKLWMFGRLAKLAATAA
jgi:hypothetical protein